MTPLSSEAFWCSGTVTVCSGRAARSGARLELTPKTGGFRLQVTFPAGRNSGREPLVVSGAPGQGQLVFVEYRPGNQAAFGTLLQGRGGLHTGPQVPIDPTKPHYMNVEINPLVPQVLVRLDGAQVSELIPSSKGVIRPVRDTTLGRNNVGGPVARTFSGTITKIPFDTPDCRRDQRRYARRQR